MKLKFSQIKNSVARATNLSSSDSRVIEYTNSAIERLLLETASVGSRIRYSVCVGASGCLTWPREIETIESVHIDNRPVTIRGAFYEALENGPGLVGSSDCSGTNSCGPCLTLLDRGNAVAFDEVPDTGYKLAIYADGTEAQGYVIVRYFDSNGQRVYTTDHNGDVIEGEELAIPAAGAYTIGTYEALPNGLYAVIKPVTKRVIRLYARLISDGTLFPLAYYEPDETVPNYRRSYITGLSACSGECETRRVTIIGKARFIPATGDDSILQIEHGDAIRLGAQAIYKEESNDFSGALTCWAMAKQLLDSQLRNYRGSGQVDPIRMVGSNTFGGNVVNLV